VTAFELGSPATAVVCLPGDVELVGFADGSLAKVTGKSDVALLPTAEWHRGRVTALAVSSKGHVCSASEDGTLVLRDARLARLGTIDLAQESDAPLSAAFTPDGKTLFVGTARGLVHRYEIRP
jgi:WD40 repeat protein